MEIHATGKNIQANPQVAVITKTKHTNNSNNKKEPSIHNGRINGSLKQILQTILKSDLLK